MSADTSFEDLVAEGLRLEQLARKLDSVGNAPEAASQYLEAASLLARAAAAVPAPLQKASQAAAGLAKAAEQLAGAANPESVGKAIALYKQAAMTFHKALAKATAPEDQAAIEQHLAELQVRVSYLECLSGNPATIPITDHIKPLKLSTAAAAAGEASTLSPTAPPPPAAAEESESAPTAMSQAMATPPPVAEAPASAVSVVTPGREESRGSGLIPGQKPDFMQEAVRMEGEARQLEAQGQLKASKERYVQCIELFAYVQKKEQNPRIRDMVRARMAELLDHAEVLSAQLILCG